MPLNEYEAWYHIRYRRTSSALTTIFLIIADLLGLLFCFAAGFFFVNLYDLNLINFKSFVTYWPYLPVFITIFGFVSLYPGASLAPAEELRRMTVSSLCIHGGINFSRYIEDGDFDPITVAFIISFIVSPIVLLSCRSLMRNFLSASRLGGIPAVIYGGGHTGRAIVDRLLKNKNTGYVPVLILDDSPTEENQYHGIPIIHNTTIGPEIVKRLHIKMAIVAMPELNRKALDKLINQSVSAFRYNVVIPDFFRFTNIWMSVRDFGGILGLATSYRLNMFWNLWIKRLIDLSIVITGGLLVSPILLGIAVLVKISSPGPVLYSHERLGKNGKHFRAYKFRSMVLDADTKLQHLLDTNPKALKEWEESHKLKNDPRITGIGKFLRRTSIDELPQLINILKGEMSLVGPRPIVDSEVKKYGEYFQKVFSIKPGLTGLWQVSGRSDTGYTDRVSFDTYYLQSWSVWLDLWIIYKTAGVIFRGSGAY
ncbi:undecaprenyl-phosphate galactose phosphotransferase WbaP [Spirochaetia bacterium]|nr:undecaprenyl-phosphate galactose phosphotransferase WbaP [Spirochaetia bacterium]